MKLEKRKPSGREKDEASIELLDQLRGKLHSADISTARRAAFNLSWMQEDGLGILQEALFGNSPKGTKIAAAYGLRCMRGRMRKMAMSTLNSGLKTDNENIKNVCTHALSLINQRTKEKSKPGRTTEKLKIKEFRSQSRPPRKNSRTAHHRTRTSEKPWWS